jgi:hypothetical protein
MFIIFGVQRKVARMATVLALCGFCHTPAAQVVTRVRSFFALFFIPVIPMGTKYRATCTMCGQTSEITPEEADQAVQAQALHQAANWAPAGSGPPASPVTGTSPIWAPPPGPPPAPMPPYNPSSGAPPTGPTSN